jgi:hypothetical protein
MDKDEHNVNRYVLYFHTPIVNRVKVLMRDESKCLCPHNLERIFKEFFMKEYTQCEVESDLHMRYLG